MSSESAVTDTAATGEASQEFERQPVPESKTKGWRSFLGMFAGEHAAGTEFMIGPLFVAHGVSAFDVLVGLLVGNVLAVLSWTFLCAPIAVKKRLTLYYQLEKICGAQLVHIYNLANGVLFCFLAGAMIAVAATAVGIPFNMPMPGLNDTMPNGIGWIVAVIVVGVVFTVVAMYGYDAVARAANIAAPWMVSVFIGCGIAALPQLGITSLGDFYEVTKEVVWTGVPAAGQSKFTFLHVMFFAWFCNMAMHIGMSDLSIFRYAKKARYGLASATGMFLGHYVAWISAGLLYAIQLQADPANQAVAPGPMAYNIAGLTGVICVVIAGWTTANPTIYRAGLAFQGVRPKWSRTRVTLVAGLVSTTGAIFPALVMKLLDFVALYGLILMPMGAVIFADFYLMKKFGLQDEYAEKLRVRFNWAAGLTWLATLLICVGLNRFGGIEIFFLGLPGWFIAVTFYLVSSKFYQRRVATQGVTA